MLGTDTLFTVAEVARKLRLSRRTVYAIISRGMLALPAATDQPAYEREGYVRAMQAANSSRGPWW